MEVRGRNGSLKSNRRQEERKKEIKGMVEISSHISEIMMNVNALSLSIKHINQHSFKHF